MESSMPHLMFRRSLTSPALAGRRFEEAWQLYKPQLLYFVIDWLCFLQLDMLFWSVLYFTWAILQRVALTLSCPVLSILKSEIGTKIWANANFLRFIMHCYSVAPPQSVLYPYRYRVCPSTQIITHSFTNHPAVLTCYFTCYLSLEHPPVPHQTCNLPFSL